MRLLAAKLISVAMALSFCNTAMADSAPLTVHLINKSGYSFDQIIFDGGVGDVADPTANFVAGIDRGASITASINFEASLWGKAHYTNWITFYAVMGENIGSVQYCQVRFDTNPTYYLLVSNRVYPSYSGAQDPEADCKLTINGDSEITITLEVP